jgi:hypothetical protein
MAVALTSSSFFSRGSPVPKFQQALRSLRRTTLRTIVGGTLVVGTLEVTTHLPSQRWSSEFYHSLADDVVTPLPRRVLNPEEAHHWVQQFLAREDDSKLAPRIPSNSDWTPTPAARRLLSLDPSSGLRSRFADFKSGLSTVDEVIKGEARRVWSLCPWRWPQALRDGPIRRACLPFEMDRSGKYYYSSRLARYS